MRIALCGIVKNEAPYLLDWIAWHRALGFTDFIIADNISDDGTSEILAQLQNAGVVTSFKMPSRFHHLPQLDAYNHAARLAQRMGIDWAAFYDADEFLMPAEDGLSFAAHLAKFPDDCGGIATSWASFGTSKLRKGDATPVPYRFTQRCDMYLTSDHHAVLVNQHYKMILRPDAFIGNFLNPHHSELKPGFKHLAMDGTELDLIRPAISQTVTWAPYRLNHYIVKSWGEYLQKKSGRGTFNKKPKLGLSFFRKRNGAPYDIEDPLPAWIKPKFEDKRAALRDIMGDPAIYDKAVADMVAFDPPPLDPPPELDVTGDIAKRALSIRRKWRRRMMRFSLRSVHPKPPLNW